MSRLIFKPYKSLENMLKANPTFVGSIRFKTDAKISDCLEKMDLTGMRYKKIFSEAGSLNIKVGEGIDLPILPFPQEIDSIDFDNNKIIQISNEAFTCDINDKARVHILQINRPYILQNLDYFMKLMHRFYNSEAGRMVVFEILCDYLKKAPDSGISGLKEKILNNVVSYIARSQAYVNITNAKLILKEHGLYDAVKYMGFRGIMDVHDLNRYYESVVEILDEVTQECNVKIVKSDPYKLVEVLDSTRYETDFASLTIQMCKYKNCEHELIVMKPTLKILGKSEDQFVSAWRRCRYSSYADWIELNGPIDLQGFIVCNPKEEINNVVQIFLEQLSNTVLESKKNKFVYVEEKQWLSVEEFLEQLSNSYYNPVYASV